MEKISIIIPVYNVEAYLKRCLDSVVNQTYRNLEILIINDGSTDNCREICDEYAANDDRIKVVHKENGGLSSALNIGLRNFTGDYLGFVDSDDWIEPNMYEELYAAASAEKAPISVVGYFKDTKSASVPMVNTGHIPNGVISTRDMLLFPLKRDQYMSFCSYVWNKLYSSKIIKTSRLEFDEKIKYGMDVLFYYTLVLAGKCTGVYTDKPLYHYTQRSAAISKSEALGTKKDILTAYKKVEEQMNRSGYSELSFWARGFYCYHASVVAGIANKTGNISALRTMQNEIKEHLEDYIETNREYPGKHMRMRELLSLSCE